MKFAIALRLVCVTLVALSHGQDVSPAPAEAKSDAGNLGNEPNGAVPDFAASVAGNSSTERAHNIGILIGIILGSVAINIVTVFAIVFCIRGNKGFAKSRPMASSQERMSRRKSERKSRYEELKDKYGLSGTDKYPRVSSVQTSQSTERLLTDEPRESSRAMSGRKSSRTTRGTIGEGEEERRSSALMSRQSQMDEDEDASPGEDKKSSIFSRLSSQIRDRVSSAIGDEGRKSSARQSSRATDAEDRRSSARQSGRATDIGYEDERRSSARPSQRGTDYGYEDERRSSARQSQRATEYPDEERRSSARATEDRRSSARQTRMTEADEGLYPTESEQMRRSSAARKSFK